MNLVHQGIDDQRLVEQARATVTLYDILRGARNDLMHGFFNWRRQSHPSPQVLTKLSAKKASGSVEMRSVPVDLETLQQLASDLHVCSESFDDLRHKFLFRNRWNDGHRGPLEHNYEDAVHGWRVPAFETAFVQEVISRWSSRSKPTRNKPQPQPGKK